MARAFWTLEDGRSFSLRWSTVAYMLEIIVHELEKINGAEKFHEFLSDFIEKDGDIYNGFGGFYRGSDNIMFNFDFRTFAPKNRELFWQATQVSLEKLILEGKKNNEGIIKCFTTLLSMHKKIKRGESPDKLNHSTIIEENPEEKIGPGWE